MQKKESYKHILPHFQQPAQAYFITWCLKEAMPSKQITKYTEAINFIKNQINFHKSKKSDPRIIRSLNLKYSRARRIYFKAFDELLVNAGLGSVNLMEPGNLKIMHEALSFWHNKKLENEAYCIMSNHVHWVFCLYEKDPEGKPVYLQDILHSVKRYSSHQINKNLGRTGALWQKESYDTTIRDNKHLYYAIEYTLNNPVSAHLGKNREDWAGNWHPHK